MSAPATQISPLDLTLQQAMAHHQAGRLAEADQFYRAILQAQPHHPDANHNLGILAGQIGQHSISLTYLKAALDASPAQKQYWLSYADALLNGGQAKEALHFLQKAIQRGFKSTEIQALRQKAKAALGNKPGQSVELTPLETKQLVALFNAGHYAELENQTRRVLNQTLLAAHAGFVWKLLGVSLQMQGKDGLLALQKAAEFLPDDVEAHINLGHALRNIGQLDNAAAGYRRALEINPSLAEVHSHLGTVLQTLGQFDRAQVSYRRALEINPDNAQTLGLLGYAQKNLGQLDEAVASFRRALELEPTKLEAHLELGNTLKDLGQLDSALASYRRALEINPDGAEAHVNLGNVLHLQGQFDSALASYRRALEIKPDLIRAHLAQAILYEAQGQLDNAVASYHQALKIDPDSADAHINLSNIFRNLGQLDQAQASCRRALEIKPDSAIAHCNQGNLLVDLKQLDNAAACYRRALEIDPLFHNAHSNLGTALLELDQPDAAVACYRRALEIKPDFADALNNLGHILKDIGQIDESVACYRRALEIKPGFALAQYGLGHSLMMLGQFSEGWHQLEKRWEGCSPKMPYPPTLLPQWAGQHASGDRLLVFEEQGSGDKLQFARYLPLAAERLAGAGRVSFVVASALHSLFQRSFPDIELLEGITADQNAWQWQCPLLSLPLVFDTTLDSIPQQIPYLMPDPQRVAGWQARIAQLGYPTPTRKIGLVWKPGRVMKNAPTRTLTLQQLAPLLNLPGCAWFSLQKEPDPDKASWVDAGQLIDWSDELGDFDDTAALASNLDLIISVDTAVAHLAGGLGLPIWLFNRHASEWRWMRDREDSRWYPTMRLFNQKKAGEWDEVVQRMAVALADMLP